MDFSSPVMKAVINNISGEPLKNVPKEVKCEVCNILVSSFVVLCDHRAGRKHKNQLKALIRTKKIDLNCIICSYLSKNFEEWELHVTSEKHVENAKRYKPIHAEVPPPQPVSHPGNPATSQIQPLLPPKELMALTAKFEEKLNQEALREIVAKDRKEFTCTHCNVTCQSTCSWEAHLASKKHRKNKHKFHTYPGISKEFVKKKYQSSFVRAAETIGNEFIEDGVVFYCKRCDCRMQTKMQLEIHMTSNQHKMNHPIAPVPVANPYPVQNNQQYFNFEQSSYGYGFRNWQGEQYHYNRQVPQMSQEELQKQQEIERQKQLVEKAKNELLARFPFYAINLQNNQNPPDPENIPMPVEAPEGFEVNNQTQQNLDTSQNFGMPQQNTNFSFGFKY